MGLHEEISELERRFAEAPDSRLFLPLADALRRAGELDRAVKLCRDGLERFPDFTSARVLLGECLADKGELKQAGEVLQQAALEDEGNRRIAERLNEITGRQSGKPEAAPAAGETDAAETSVEAQEAETDRGAADSADNQAGESEMIATGTLGDIYEQQGHDRQAFEVYSKLVAEGKADQVVKDKLAELAGRLGEQLPGGETQDSGAVEGSEESGEAVMGMARAEGGEGRFEERIDKIFHFLLGDSPEHAELGHSTGSSAHAAGPSTAAAGSGGFVDMLEDWIDDIRQGK